MAKFDRIEEINVWKEGIDLVLSVYKLTENYKFAKDFGLKDQVRRCAVSVPSNIAEGFERATNQEFIRFLYIAKGSGGELRTQIYIAYNLNYISQEEFKSIHQHCKQISSMLMNLIKTLKP